MVKKWCQVYFWSNKKRYAIYGSGPLGVRKIREVNDLDIIVTDELYQKLKEKYSEDAGKERIKLRTFRFAQEP